MNNAEFQAQSQRIEQLVQRASALQDTEARNIALELMQSLMDLHGAVLSRIVERLAQSGDAGASSLAKLGSDPLVCGLLVLYGIHPVSLEDRVKRAIEKLGPELRKQAASIKLLNLADCVVHVKIETQSHGLASSPEKLKTAVEHAILEAAPEVVEIVTEGMPLSGFIPLSMIQPATREENFYEKSTP
jgi:Fe-S cluster biogenesis protein NfuA